MWSDPYLETCCRSALHRLALARSVGRPATLQDGPCLERLLQMGMARMQAGQRFEITDVGMVTHELLVRPGSTQHGYGKSAIGRGDGK